MKVTLEDSFYLYYTMHLSQWHNHVKFDATIESLTAFRPLAIATRFQDLVRLFESSVKQHNRFKQLCHLSKRLGKEYDIFEKEHGPFGYVSPQKIRTITTFQRKRGSSELFFIREEYIQEVFLGTLKDKFNSKANTLKYTPPRLQT